MLDDRICAALNEGDECVRLLLELRPKLVWRMWYHAAITLFILVIIITADPARVWPSAIGATLIMIGLYLWVRDFLRTVKQLITSRDAIANWDRTKWDALKHYNVIQ